MRRSLAWFNTESVFRSRLSSEAQVYAVVLVPVNCGAAVSFVILLSCLKQLKSVLKGPVRKPTPVLSCIFNN